MKKIEDIVGRVATRHGCELVDVVFRREPAGWVLRALIDKPDGVGVEVCADMSRDLSPELDVAEVIDHAYHLEVSSPGLDRPLKKAADFRRYFGRRAKLSTREPCDGRRNFVGEILGVTSDETAVELAVDGQRFTIPLSSISRANLKIEI